MLRTVTMSRDRWPKLAWFALGGLPTAGLLAVFGMPPVNLHGPLHHLGIMGPLCGMTRGVAAAARGDLGTALAYNPVSLLLIPGAVVVLVRTAWGRATGRWIDATILRPRPVLAIAIVAVVALTVNQQLRVELLAGP